MTDLPHDIAAEQVVLGAMMLSPGAVADVGAEISPVDHYRPAHQAIHATILGLADRGAPHDPVAVKAELERLGELRGQLDAPYLHTLINAVPAAVNAGHYARIVADAAERRRLIEHADRIRQDALQPGVDMASIRALAARVPAPRVPAADSRGRRLLLTRASQIAPEPVVWAWEDNGAGRIPAGSLGLFAGREGTGKSSFLIWLTAKVTTGTLPGSFRNQPKAVIYVAVEDSWKYTIVPRLIASGADLDRVYRAEVHTVADDTVSLSLPADLVLLEEAITANGVAMVALDPLMSAISDALDTHVNRQVRQALDPLARIADRTGAVIAGIAHFGKAIGVDASSLITGSAAFKDVARYIFAFATDPEDGAQVITQTKNSLGVSDLPSFSYRIISATVPTGKGDANVGRFVLGDITERSVQDILSTPGGSDPKEADRAKEYLQKALAAGPRRTKEVEEESREAEGIARRTLVRARGELGIKTAKVGKDWWISLPEHEGDLHDLRDKPRAAETSKDANGAKHGTDGTDDADADAKCANSAKSASPGVVGTHGTHEPDTSTLGQVRRTT